MASKLKPLDENWLGQTEVKGRICRELRGSEAVLKQSEPTLQKGISQP